MPHGFRKMNISHPLPLTTKDRDNAERDKARTTVLNLWSLASLEEILPRDLLPLYWSKSLIQHLAALASRTTLLEAKTLLSEQVLRRRREAMLKQVDTREFLIILDVNAVLGRLDGTKQDEELKPPADLTVTNPLKKTPQFYLDTL